MTAAADLSYKAPQPLIWMNAKAHVSRTLSTRPFTNSTLSAFGQYRSLVNLAGMHSIRGKLDCLKLDTQVSFSTISVPLLKSHINTNIALYLSFCGSQCCIESAGEQKGGHEITKQAGQSNSSAIWTALRAAPFLIWSPHTKRSRPRLSGLEMSLRIRPTNTSSSLEASKGVGNLLALRSLMMDTPAALDRMSRAWTEDLHEPSKNTWSLLVRESAYLMCLVSHTGAKQLHLQTKSSQRFLLHGIKASNDAEQRLRTVEKRVNGFASLYIGLRREIHICLQTKFSAILTNLVAFRHLPSSRIV